MQNFVVRVIRDGRARRITLSSCILAKDESADEIADAILREFKHGSHLLDHWREATTQLYPNNPELLDDIPEGSKLSITKLGLGSFTTTDTCNTARKLRRVLDEHVKRIAVDEGLSVDAIITYEADCWQHLRNVWLGAAAKSLENELREILAEDLKSLPDIYRIDLGIDDAFRCVEKVFGLSANYAKGQGAQFQMWQNENYADEYLYPIARACRGTRQDLCVEGAPAVLMNLLYYLRFLNWRIAASGGKSEAILQTKLYIMLRSTEFVTMLRVLSILHISVCLPLRWLAGKSHELAEYGFGYYDMGKALNAMEAAFEEVVDNGELLFDEDFMMNMFAEISSAVDPFKEYLDYIFEEKLGDAPNHNIDDKVCPWDQVRAAVFYPSRADILQTDQTGKLLAVIAATAFLGEFRDRNKQTHHYLSSLNGKYSLAIITEEQRNAGLGKEAANSISESNFASATQSLKTYGTIRLDSAAAEGQTRTNNDFGRDANTNVSDKECGLLFQLKPELVKSLFHGAKCNAPSLCKRFNVALKLLNVSKLNKLKADQLKELEKKEEQYILVMDYYERGCSVRRWKSAAEANRIYQELTSESRRLNAVKEQILIRKIGFGWLDCAHQWSRDGYHYSSKELLQHLINTVIPLEIERGVPSEAPMMESSGLTDKYTLGTETALDFKDYTLNVKTVEEMKLDAEEERRRREDDCETDRHANLQPNVMPQVDDTLVGFPIEYLFEYYDDEDDSQYTAWCDGTVHRIINNKTRMVEIKWNEKKVAPGDVLVSKQKLGLRKWNPKNPTPGAWRKFVGNPDA